MSQGPFPNPPQKARGCFRRTVLILFCFAVLGYFLSCSLSSLLGERKGKRSGFFRDRVAIVPIHGTMFDAEDWVELLEDCVESRSIKGVVLDIDSPGGGIAAAQQLYDAAQRIRKEGKPVVAFLGPVAASGGYYLASAADQIIAMPGSLTGSIGVYIQLFNIGELLEGWGIKSDTIKKGTFKTAGDFTRDLLGSERKMFQAVVDDYYQQFIEVVTENRLKNRTSIARGWNEMLPGGTVESGTQEVGSGGGIMYPGPAWAGLGTAPAAIVITATEEARVASDVVDPSTKAEELKAEDLLADQLSEAEIRERITELAEGRIYTGRQAMKVGLVDKLGTLQDAIDRAGVLSGLGTDPDTVYKDVDTAAGLLGLIRNYTSRFEGSPFLYMAPIGR